MLRSEIPALLALYHTYGDIGSDHDTLYIQQVNKTLTELLTDFRDIDLDDHTIILYCLDNIPYYHTVMSLFYENLLSKITTPDNLFPLYRACTILHQMGRFTPQILQTLITHPNPLFIALLDLQNSAFLCTRHTFHTFMPPQLITPELNTTTGIVKHSPLYWAQQSPQYAELAALLQANSTQPDIEDVPERIHPHQPYRPQTLFPDMQANAGTPSDEFKATLYQNIAEYTHHNQLDALIQWFFDLLPRDHPECDAWQAAWTTYKTWIITQSHNTHEASHMPRYLQDAIDILEKIAFLYDSLPDSEKTLHQKEKIRVTLINFLFNSNACIPGSYNALLFAFSHCIPSPAPVDEFIKNLHDNTLLKHTLSFIKKIPQYAENPGNETHYVKAYEIAARQQMGLTTTDDPYAPTQRNLALSHTFLMTLNQARTLGEYITHMIKHLDLRHLFLSSKKIELPMDPSSDGIEKTSTHIYTRDFSQLNTTLNLFIPGVDWNIERFALDPMNGQEKIASTDHRLFSHFMIHIVQILELSNRLYPATRVKLQTTAQKNTQLCFYFQNDTLFLPWIEEQDQASHELCDIYCRKSTTTIETIGEIIHILYYANPYPERKYAPLQWIMFLDSILPFVFINKSEQSKLIKNLKKYMLLHLVTQHKKIHLVETFIKKNVPLDQKDKNGNTPLHIAIQFDHLDIMRLLLRNGASLEIQNEAGETPLIFAMTCENDSAIGILIEHNANLDTFGSELEEFLILLIQQEHPITKAIARLIHHGVSYQQVIFDRKPLLHWAAQHNYCDILEAILMRADNCLNQQNPEILNTTALHIAVLHRSIEAVTLLIQYNADCNIKNNFNQTPLHYALNTNHIDHPASVLQICTLLLNALTTIIDESDYTEDTALHYAANMNIHYVIPLFCTKLKSQHQTLDTQNQDGNTPLDLAIISENVESLHGLLDHGATCYQPGTETDIKLLLWILSLPSEQTDLFRKLIKIERFHRAAIDYLQTHPKEDYQKYEPIRMVLEEQQMALHDIHETSRFFKKRQPITPHNSPNKKLKSLSDNNLFINTTEEFNENPEKRIKLLNVDKSDQPSN